MALTGASAANSNQSNTRTAAAEFRLIAKIKRSIQTLRCSLSGARNLECRTQRHRIVRRMCSITLLRASHRGAG